jgi:carbamoyltransferase
MFVQPAASDDGTALGAALYAWTHVLGCPYPLMEWSSSKGRCYTEHEIMMAIHGAPTERLHIERSTDMAKIARIIASGKIVGWFNGGSEFGPRALGNRSILADPRRPEMKNVLNAQVKKREGYRPYAASVISERASEWFDIDYESPHMLFVVDVRKEQQSLVPSITHVDGTCRVQMVRAEELPTYHELISTFFRETGVPMVLNTSFNVAGEPIVETPVDAVRCFVSTEIDALYLDGYLLSKAD